MPLMRNGKHVPARGAAQNSWRPLETRDYDTAPVERVEIALVNNMPDAALEDTENQFLDLLAAASGDIPVRVQLYSLPEICRSERARQHMHGRYSEIRDLLNNRCDALIITGTEPHEPNLRKESYWNSLVDLLDWAEQNTASTILSCLAAHAGVLHSDGIARHLLNDKRFGVFAERNVSEHVLMTGTASIIRIPHSRWNELRENDLTSCGYVVLTKSAEAGVGLFAKLKRKSLCLHVQGHPEYGTKTLLKEYRRDIKRFLRQERETYPSMPRGYFGAMAVKRLRDFREQALADRQERILAAFPDALIAGALQNGWHASGARMYRNWLQYVASRKTGAAKYSVMAASSGHVERKRSTAS